MTMYAGQTVGLNSISLYTVVLHNHPSAERNFLYLEYNAFFLSCQPKSAQMLLYAKKIWTHLFGQRYNRQVNVGDLSLTQILTYYFTDPKDFLRDKEDLQCIT